MKEKEREDLSPLHLRSSQSDAKALTHETSDQACKVVELAVVPAGECSANGCTESPPYFRIESEASQRALCIQHVVAILEWLDQSPDPSGRRGTREKPEWRLNERERGRWR